MKNIILFFVGLIVGGLVVGGVLMFNEKNNKETISNEVSDKKEFDKFEVNKKNEEYCLSSEQKLEEENSDFYSQTFSNNCDEVRLYDSLKYKNKVWFAKFNDYENWYDVVLNEEYVNPSDSDKRLFEEIVVDVLNNIYDINMTHKNVFVDKYYPSTVDSVSNELSSVWHIHMYDSKGRYLFDYEGEPL